MEQNPSCESSSHSAS